MDHHRPADKADDQQIEDGYARLGTALAPPPDVTARVERAVGARRRRRRTSLGAVTGLVVAGTVGGAVLLAGGDDEDGDTVATDRSGESRGSFVLTRPDGSTTELTDLTVSCTAPPIAADEETPGGPQRIWLYSPFHLDASGDELVEPVVYFEAIVAKVDGRTFDLPFNSESGDSDTRAFVLFAAEPRAGGSKERGNEVSSAEVGAAGTVVVSQASCDPAPVLELEVDTTLGSEVEQGTLDLAGSYR